ncbi:MAG: alpha/beta hydrolase [Pirellulales bacterium]|nr:alpha/beta hydrolase [Pirellulales bacterium]
MFSFFENSLVYFPAKYPTGDWNPLGLEFEDAWFEAADGTKLHGWYVPHPSPRAVILFAHGNGGNLTGWAEDLRQIHARAGASVMIFDYRGYGRSAGSPNEVGVLQDARAARAWLAERAGVREQDIVLMGTSLGGGVMVDLAAHDGARALVLQNTFTSLVDVAKFHFGWLPASMLMRNRLDSAAKIGRFHGPLLQSHGDIDTIVPYALGRKLFEQAHEPKQFLTLEGFQHNDLHPPEYFEALGDFLSNLPPL